MLLRVPLPQRGPPQKAEMPDTMWLLLGCPLVTPAPLVKHDTPILHPHRILEAEPHPEVSVLQPHPAVPVPVPSFLPLAGARKKRSPDESGQSSALTNLLTNNTLPLSFSFDPDTKSIVRSDIDYFDSAESQLIGIFNTSDVNLIQLRNHKNDQNSSWEPCLIPGGQLSDIGAVKNTILLEKLITSPRSVFSLPKNNFNSDDTDNLALIKSDLLENISTEKLSKISTVTKNPSIISSKVFHTSQHDQFIEETTTPFPTGSTPGSIPSTPSWSFPTEGNKKHSGTQGFLTDQTSSVYFDPNIRKSFSVLQN